MNTQRKLNTQLKSMTMLAAVMLLLGMAGSALAAEDPAPANLQIREAAGAQEDSPAAIKAAEDEQQRVNTASSAIMAPMCRSPNSIGNCRFR